jgi:AcrR family transcriptional regulator
MPSKQTEIKVESILKATQAIIASEGVEAVTMPRIALASKLSRPAIYQYFSSREHILAELVINEIADLSNALDSHLDKIKGPLEQTRIWIHYSLGYLASAEHRVISQISMRILPEESRGMLNAMHGHFMTSLINPLTILGVADAAGTAHLIFASIAEAAKRIDGGSAYENEAAILERFVIAGIVGATNPSTLP